MTENRKVDLIGIQRLVDGELSQQDRAALLREIESQPHLWRHIALSFVEDQIFQREIPGFSALTLIDVPQQPVKDVVALSNRSEASRSRFQSWRSLLSLAASILLLTFGFFIGRQLESGAAVDTPKAEHSIAGLESGPTRASNSQLVSSNDGWVEAGRLSLTDTDKPGTSAWELPVYQVSNMDPRVVLGRDVEQLHRMNRQLQQRGYELDVQSHLFGGELPDGRSVIVPIRNVGLRPYGQ